VSSMKYSTKPDLFVGDFWLTLRLVFDLCLLPVALL